jgi:hypothetical protein
MDAVYANDCADYTLLMPSYFAIAMSRISRICSPRKTNVDTMELPHDKEMQLAVEQRESQCEAVNKIIESK